MLSIRLLTWTFSNALDKENYVERNPLQSVICWQGTQRGVRRLASSITRDGEV